MELTRRAFAKNNITSEVVVLPDGVRACEFLFEGDRGRRGYPQLILLDLKLPKLTGLEVARIRAAERTRLAPTIILTSSTENVDRSEGCRRGANSYVRKPADFSEFVEAVRQVGLPWMVLNEPPPVSWRRWNAENPLRGSSLCAGTPYVHAPEQSNVDTKDRPLPGGPLPSRMRSAFLSGPSYRVWATIVVLAPTAHKADAWPDVE